MYPRTYYETCCRYQASHDVFVAMPFSDDFQAVFEGIIAPSIRNVKVNGQPLTPNIINRTTWGSPDIHEKIYDAIIHSRLVLADMTVQARWSSRDGNERWQANANVTYEVGLAAAWRNPEDILLIHQQSDHHSYSFDIQNLRHVMYDANDIDASISILTSEISDCLRSSNFIANQSFSKLAKEVSPTAANYMHVEARRVFPTYHYTKANTLPQIEPGAQAIKELLSIGALQSRHITVQNEETGISVIYEWTELGIKLMRTWRAIDEARQKYMYDVIQSTDRNNIPPQEHMAFPEATPKEIHTGE